MKAEIWIERNDNSIKNRIKFLPESSFTIYSKDIKSDKISTLIPLFQPYFKGKITPNHFKHSIFVFYPKNKNDSKFISKIQKILNGTEETDVTVVSARMYEIILMKDDFILSLRSKGKEVIPLKEKLIDFLSKLGD